MATLHDLLLPESEVPSWQAETEVLVVGAGCAGVSAAIEAARAGASTMVLERAGGIGGTSALSGAVIYLGGGTPVQRQCGFQDTADEMYRYLEASTGIGPDREKLRIYCDGSVEHFEWLCSMDIPFKGTYWPHNFEPYTDDCLFYSGSEHTGPFRSIAVPAPRGHTVQAEGSCTGGRVLMEKLAEKMQQAGAKSVVDTKATALIQARNGRIVGVAAKTAGDTHFIRARRGLVLTTGGFINNRAMVERYLPQAASLEPLGSPGDDGSGIQLARAAGADFVNPAAAAYACPILVPFQLKMGILFNAYGQRFINEDVNHKRIGEHVILHQNGKVFLLVDNSIFSRPQYGTASLVATGDTIREVEEEMRLTRGTLERTVEIYNAGAERGEDTLFGKQPDMLKSLREPPFGVFDCSVGAGMTYLAFTLGGLRTRPTGEVVSIAGDAIPGLYAAGMTTSALSAQSCGSSGLQVGGGTFFGRLAGRAAAREPGSS